MQAWTRWPVCPLYGQPQDTPEESGVVDEALLGMPVTVTGPQQGSRVPVRTFYGYSGWMEAETLTAGPEAEALPLPPGRWSGTKTVWTCWPPRGCRRPMCSRGYPGAPGWR